MKKSRRICARPIKKLSLSWTACRWWWTSIFTLDKDPLCSTHQGTYCAVVHRSQKTPKRTVQKASRQPIWGVSSWFGRSENWSIRFSDSRTRKVGNHPQKQWHCKIWDQRWAEDQANWVYKLMRTLKLWKSTEAKTLSHIKEFTRIEKGDRMMKHCKRDTASCISSNRSNIARAMRVRMPKVPPISRRQTSFEPEAISAPQVTTSQLIFAPPAINQPEEIMIPFTSAPLEALHQVRPRTTKRARKSPKYFGFENDDPSGESTKSWPPNPTQPRRKRRAGDFNRYNFLWYKPFLIQQPKQSQSVIRSPRKS